MKRYCFTFILTALNIIAFPPSIALRSNAKHGKSRKKSKAGKATKSKYKFHKSYSKSSRNGELSNQSLVPSRIPSIEPSIQSSIRSSLSKMPSIQNISTQIPSSDSNNEGLSTHPSIERATVYPTSSPAPSRSSEPSIQSSSRTSLSKKPSIQNISTHIPSSDSNNEGLSTHPSIVTDYQTPLPAPSRSSEPSIQSSTRTSLSKMPSIHNISTHIPSSDSNNEGLTTHPSIERATVYPTSLPAPSRSSIFSTAPSKVDRISSSMPISGSSYGPSRQLMLSLSPSRRDKMQSSFPTIRGLDSPLPSNKPTFKAPTLDSNVVNNTEQQNVAESRSEFK